MAPKPEPLATAILPDVAGDPVPDAQAALREFSNVVWLDLAGRKWTPPPANYAVIREPVDGHDPETPVDQIGHSIPTDTAITITIAQSSVPRG